MNSKFSLRSEIISQKMCMFEILIDVAKLFFPSLTQDGTSKPTFLTK